MVTKFTDAVKSIKIATWIILAITLIIVSGAVLYVQYNPSILEQRNIKSTNESIMYYTLFGVIVFAVITYMAVKIDMSAVYTMKCRHGADYREKLTDREHVLYRLWHSIPIVGDLTNIVLFHTCSRKSAMPIYTESTD